MRSLCQCVLLCALLAATSGCAATQAMPVKPLPPAEQWQVAIAPYFWAASMSGEIDTAATSETDFNNDFGEVWDDLKFGGMLALEARDPRSPWAFLLDSLYLKLEDEVSNGEIEVTQTVLEADFAYRPNADHALDFLAGLRFWNLDSEVERNGIGTIETDRSFVDPVIGLRELIPFSDRFSLQARADIGGFGLGSDISWQLLGTLRWEIARSASVAAGYRWIYVDYDHNDFELAVDYFGPILGLVLAF